MFPAAQKRAVHRAYKRKEAFFKGTANRNEKILRIDGDIRRLNNNRGGIRRSLPVLVHDKL